MKGWQRKAWKAVYSVQGWESANRQSENNRCLQLVLLVLVSEVTGVNQTQNNSVTFDDNNIFYNAL